MANSITLQVQFQNTAAIADIQNLNQAIGQIAVVAARTGAATTVAFNQATNSADNLQRSISGLTQAFAALQIARLAKEMAMLGDEMYRLQRFFEINAIGGGQMFDDLHAAALRTHTAFVDLANDARLLVNVGMPLKEVTHLAETLALRVKQAGGSQEDLNRAIQGMATLYAKGFVTGRDLVANFINTGLVPMKIMTDATGMSIQQLRESMKTIDVKSLITLIEYQAQEDVSQSKMAERATTLRDALNDLKTAWGDLATVLGDDFGRAAVMIINLVTDLIRGFMAIPQWIRVATITILALTAALWTLVKVVDGIKAAVGGVKALMNALAEPELVIAAVALTAIAVALYKINDVTKDVKGRGVFEKWLTPDDKKKAQDTLFQPDVKKIEEATRQAADLMDQAQKRYYLAGKESIEALSYEYEEYFRKIGLGARLTAEVQIAYDYDVLTAVKKHHEESQTEVLKAQNATETALRRFRVARDTMEPDDTFAGREQARQAAAADYALQVKQQTDEEVMALAKKAVAQKVALEEWGFDTEAKAYWDDYLAVTIALNSKANTEIAAHDEEAAKESLALRRQYEKQLRDEQVQDTVNAIDRITKLRTAVISTVIPANRNEQIAQINATTEAQIRGIQEVSDARIQASKDEEEIFKALHPGGVGVPEEVQRQEHIRAELSKNTETEIQLDRISAWKSANQIIIEQQKEMFDSIKGVLDRIWDAALDKSKSFWHSLGSIIKDTITSIFKTIVTNRVAGGLASALGFGPFAYGTGYDALRPPVPLGRQSPFQMPAAEQSRSVFKALAGAFSPGSTAGPAGSGSMAPATTPEGQAQQQVSNQITDLARQVNSTAATVQATAPDSYSLSGYGGGPGGGGYDGGVGGGGGSSYGGVGLGAIYARSGSSASGGSATVTSQVRAATSLKDSFNIGKPIWVDNGEGGVKSIPWSQASASAQLGAIVKSPGFNTALLGTGSMLALSGFQKGTTGGLVQGVAGSTAAGIGAAGLFSGLGLSAIGGGALGAGAGLLAAGLIHGGKVGLGLDIGGGALTGAVIGTMILPGIGTALGAGIGAAAGAIAGGIRMLIPGMDQQIRSGVKRLYGVDITDKAIRDQIATIVKNNYGGSLSVGLYSLEVQNLVRLYAATTGQQAGLPRPMYGVAQAQQGGQLQTQPVYSSGQLVQNPYTGTTTYQYAQQGMYMQLDPNQAMQLFSGQVVNVVQNNPATIAQANATALAAGNARYATLGSLVEPSTVMA